MARYYCKNCKSLIESNTWRPELDDCPLCYTKRDYLRSLALIPDYETPAQYKKRTGEKWADESPVFYREFSIRCEWGRWHVADYHNAKHYDDTSQWTVQIVIASPPVPPLDDFAPEGG